MCDKKVKMSYDQGLSGLGILDGRNVVGVEGGSITRYTRGSGKWTELTRRGSPHTNQ